MGSRKITNYDLQHSIAGSGVIEIYEWTEDNLQFLQFLDNERWPTPKCVSLLGDLEKISPTELDSNPRLWDPLDTGEILHFFGPAAGCPSLYNQFLELPDGE